MSSSKNFVRKESSKQTLQAEERKNYSFTTHVERDNTGPNSYTKPQLHALITGIHHLLRR